MRCIGKLLACIGLGALLLPALASAGAQAQQTCEEETLALRARAEGLKVTVSAPADLAAGGLVHVRWSAPQGLPAASGAQIVVAVPGEVRFLAAPQKPKAPPPKDGTVAEIPPDLGGFVALPPQARGPRGLAFGAAATRALIPLHQPGSRLAGSLDILVLAAGSLEIETALVADGRCGERIIGETARHAFSVRPGRPEIVVQDPYDIERPSKVILAPSGRYRANVFDGRYRIYDTETGAKLVDRAGHDVNFSPTSRFAAAAVGDPGSRAREIIDLAAREVTTTVEGAFLGWTHSDAFLIVGHAAWGHLFVRPTLVSRRGQAGGASAEGAQLGDTGSGGEDGLAFSHPGSCHACASWTDDNMMLDLDNGILAFTGSFDADSERVYELASGATLCCTKAGQVEPFVARTYGLAAFKMEKGWHAREPIRFTHIYDALADPRGKDFADQEWFQAAKPLRAQWLAPRTQDPQAAPIEVAGLSGASVVRGDWRARVTALARTDTGPDALRRRITTELARLGLIAAPALEREQIDMVNSWAGDDRLNADGSSGGYDRIDKMIARRTAPLRQRLVREIPALGVHLKRPGEKPKEGYDPPLPMEGLGKGKISLEDTLEGLWRWSYRGRPLWLLQLWATQGNGGFGEGMMFLLKGEAAGKGAASKAKAGRIVDLSKPLEAFWSGAYGRSDHQTRLKPGIFLERYLVAASVAQKTIAVYDLETDRVLAVFKDAPQADLISEVVLTANASHVLQINADGQFFIHDVATGRVVVSGRAVDDEIVAYTAEGYYWATYEGAHFVQLRFPGLPGLYPFQQFASALERPDIIKAQLKARATAPAAPPLNPPPTLAVSRKGGGAGGPDRLAIEARSGVGLARLRLYADGQPVADLPLSGRAAQSELALPQTGDARWLTVQVADTVGIVSTPQALRLTPQGPKVGRLFAVLVGIDEYRDPRLTLRYAKSDAQRLAAALEATAGAYYGKPGIQLLSGAAAHKTAILSALQRAVADAAPGDTVVFSFAGHGDQDKGTGRFFLTPADFDARDVARTGLAWSDIAETLRGAKARVVVILDACHSGLSGAEQRTTNDEAVGALLSGMQAPMLVLAASKGRQSSYEDQRWGGGLFTHALVEALQAQRASYDIDRDGAIAVSELYRALKTIVVPQSGGLQTPWLARRDLIGDFALF
ncbi:MAG: caspase family protein [Hyphomicrobiaceae bacterium]|nr:caspase family protein [Hyphomicrobiaceae bacterium]